MTIYKSTPRPCRKIGCPGKTTDKTGYCDKHKKTENGWSRNERTKGNRHKRGYGYQWEKLRQKILKRDEYLCQPSLRKGLVVVAEEVDHIIPKEHGGTDEESNLQSISKVEHRAKTAKERGRKKSTCNQ